MSAGKTRPSDAWSAARMENSASAASATDGRPMSSVAGASEVEEGETAVVVASGPRNGRGDERWQYRVPYGAVSRPRPAWAQSFEARDLLCRPRAPGAVVFVLVEVTLEAIAAIAGYTD